MGSQDPERVAAHDAPPGFRPLPFDQGFIGHNGPLFGRRDPDGRAVFGFRVLPHLCNPMGVCHGGWIATAFDMVLPLSARVDTGEEDRFLLTVQMSVDYLAGPKLGDWVEGRGEVLRRTKRMVFVQGLLSVADAAVARGSGIFRLGPPAPGFAV